MYDYIQVKIYACHIMSKFCAKIIIKIFDIFSKYSLDYSANIFGLQHIFLQNSVKIGISLYRFKYPNTITRTLIYSTAVLVHDVAVILRLGALASEIRQCATCHSIENNFKFKFCIAKSITLPGLKNKKFFSGCVVLFQQFYRFCFIYYWIKQLHLITFKRNILFNKMKSMYRTTIIKSTFCCPIQ